MIDKVKIQQEIARAEAAGQQGVQMVQQGQAIAQQSAGAIQALRKLLADVERAEAEAARVASPAPTKLKRTRRVSGEAVTANGTGHAEE